MAEIHAGRARSRTERPSSSGWCRQQWSGNDVSKARGAGGSGAHPASSAHRSVSGVPPSVGRRALTAPGALPAASVAASSLPTVACVQASAAGTGLESLLPQAGACSCAVVCTHTSMRPPGGCSSTDCAQSARPRSPACPSFDCLKLNLMISNFRPNSHSM